MSMSINRSFLFHPNASSNATQAESHDSGGVPLWFVALNIAISAVTIIGNGVLVLLISLRAQLRSDPSPNWFILSLGLADLFVGLLSTPVDLLCWFAVECSPLATHVWKFFADSALEASVANLCVLTLDRYLAVAHPFVHLSLVTPSRCLILIAIAWIVAFAQMTPYLIYDVQMVAAGEESGRKLELEIIYMVLFSILPIFFMIYAYARILIVVRRHRRLIRTQSVQVASNHSNSGSTGEPGSSRVRGNKHGAMAAVGVVVMVFLVCRGWYLYSISCKVAPGCDWSIEVRAATSLLLYFNSAPNAFVYALMKTDFRRELKNILRC